MTLGDATTTRIARRAVSLQRMELAGAHQLEISTDGQAHELRITDRNGGLGITISVREDGVILHLERADLAIRADGNLELSAERLHLHGRSGLALSSDGDLEVEASGDITSAGRIQHIKATRGNVNVEANDDVRLEGERVRLNC